MANTQASLNGLAKSRRKTRRKSRLPAKVETAQVLRGVLCIVVSGQLMQWRLPRARLLKLLETGFASLRRGR